MRPPDRLPRPLPPLVDRRIEAIPQSLWHCVTSRRKRRPNPDSAKEPSGLLDFIDFHFMQEHANCSHGCAQNLHADIASQRTTQAVQLHDPVSHTADGQVGAELSWCLCGQ